jgi:hypothetical protein
MKHERDSIEDRGLFHIEVVLLAQWSSKVKHTVLVHLDDRMRT